MPLVSKHSRDFSAILPADSYRPHIHIAGVTPLHRPATDRFLAYHCRNSMTRQLKFLMLFITPARQVCLKTLTSQDISSNYARQNELFRHLLAIFG